jgi:hypothetical protein
VHAGAAGFHGAGVHTGGGFHGAVAASHPGFGGARVAQWSPGFNGDHRWAGGGVDGLLASSPSTGITATVVSLPGRRGTIARIRRVTTPM